MALEGIRVAGDLIQGEELPLSSLSQEIKKFAESLANRIICRALSLRQFITSLRWKEAE
jgi:hypothetical protein